MHPRSSSGRAIGWAIFIRDTRSSALPSRPVDEDRLRELLALDEAERPFRRYWNHTGRSYDTNFWRGRRIGQRVRTEDGEVGTLVELHSHFGVGMVARIVLEDGTKVSRQASKVHPDPL